MCFWSEFKNLREIHYAMTSLGSHQKYFFASIFRGWVCSVAEKAIVQEIFSSETIARMLSHAAENACAVPRSHWKRPGTMCMAVLWKSFPWEHLLLVERYCEYLAAHRPLEVKLCYATR